MNENTTAPQILNIVVLENVNIKGITMIEEKDRKLLLDRIIEKFKKLYPNVEIKVDNDNAIVQSDHRKFFVEIFNQELRDYKSKYLPDDKYIGNDSGFACKDNTTNK